MILSLDVSSKCTGWAIYSPCGNLLSHGSFKPAGLADFYAQLLLLINQCTEVVAEQIYCGINKTTFKLLAKYQGIVELACLQHGIQAKYLSAVEWRKKLGWPRLKRAEAKKKAIATVEELYGIKVNEDTAEACCLGQAYMKGEV